jgi:single-stranded-DNA-specific exonuclease
LSKDKIKDGRGCELKNEWEVADPHKEWEDFLCEKFNISPLLARLLTNRGADTIEKVEQFLNPDSIKLEDPYKMHDMDKAIEELLRMRESGAPLVIYGDYDVDGVTGTALYYLVLKKWGWNVDYYIPSRLDDGYGLGKDAIDFLYEKGVRNLMTVDCGITSVEEISYANSRGFRVIVTDHHETKDEIPDAVAVIDPKRPDDRYPFKDFSGVGVAYKVLQALKLKTGIQDDLEEYLDIVALGTVADIVPLLWENRYFVYKGMKLLGKKKRVGLAKLMEMSNVDTNDIKAHDIGFRIAPKINAVGRIDSAYTALKLVLEKDETKAYELAKELIDKNKERQSIENQIFQQALAQLDVMSDLEERRILVLSGENWHPGVIGIVASRILSAYHKPTLMISKEGEIARGSARSIEGVDIVKILKGAEDLLEEYGGHKMAAGFSLKTELIPKFDERLQKLMKEYDSDDLTSVVKVDAKMNLVDVNESLIQDIEKLRPYGSGNPEPIFQFDDLEVERARNVGRLGKHLSLVVRQNFTHLDAIGFGFSNKVDDTFYLKASLSVVANIWKNTWNGRQKVQLNIIDLKVKDSGNVSTAFKRSVVKKRKFSKELTFEGTALVVGTPHVEEKMILEASLFGKSRLVVVTPSNSMMREFYNSLSSEIRSFGRTVTYIDAMNRGYEHSHVVFTNVLSLPNVLKDGDRLFVCEPQIMYEAGMREKIVESIHQKKPEKILLFSSFLAHDVEADLMADFDIEKVFHEFHKRTVGLIDDRNAEDKFEMVSLMIKSDAERMMIVFSNVKNLKVTSKRICELYSLMCKSEKIVSYVPNSNSYHHHISNLIKRGKTRVLLTTSAYASTIEEMDKIVYYDFPRNHLSFLKPPTLLENNNHVPLIHMLFGESDFNSNMKDIDQLFPSYERVRSAAEILSNGCNDEPEECLVAGGLTESKTFSKIFLSILKEIDVFDGKRVVRIPEREEVENSLREREGQIEKRIAISLRKKLMDKNTRDIARIFHNPFDGNYAKSVR